jgi:hypothetical protein
LIELVWLVEHRLRGLVEKATLHWLNVLLRRLIYQLLDWGWSLKLVERERLILLLRCKEWVGRRISLKHLRLSLLAAKKAWLLYLGWLLCVAHHRRLRKWLYV